MIHVVAAAVTDAQGRVLIAQRPPGKHLAGGWEFPGGKVEQGETRVQALTRELDEELGITLTAYPRPLMRLKHLYPYGEVLLDMWVVTRFCGDPVGRDGQAVRWCTQDELERADELLPADRPLVRALRLPERLTEIQTSLYKVADLNFWRSSNRSLSSPAEPFLCGVSCRDIEECNSAEALPHLDFLVIRNVLSQSDVAAVCRVSSVPVFVSGLGLESAWQSGASGVFEQFVRKAPV